jgi:hypothetical protein
MRIDYTMWDSPDEGKVYRVLLDISSVKLLTNKTYEGELYNKIFDFFREIKTMNLPDSPPVPEVILEEDNA